MSDDDTSESGSSSEPAAEVAPVANAVSENVNSADAIRRTSRVVTTLEEVEEQGEQDIAADDTEAVVGIEENDVPLGVMDEEDETVVIKDDEVAKAAKADIEEGAKRFWWWIIPIVAAITGKTTYDKKYEKGIFKKSKNDEDNE